MDDGVSNLRYLVGISEILPGHAWLYTCIRMYKPKRMRT